MSGDRLRWVLLILIVLAGGWLLGRSFWLPPEPSLDTTGGEFRAWFWEARGLDIAVQVGLIMAGALGVAALLPQSEDQG